MGTKTFVQRLIQDILNYAGLQLGLKRKLVDLKAGDLQAGDLHRCAYYCSLTTALGSVEELKIVVVGANDGRIGDPIYNFIRFFQSRTMVVLVEPQSNVIPALEKNYSFHKKKKIINRAVGPGDRLIIYSVDESCWNDIEVPYAKDWPKYRAATGVTSTDREHLRRWLERYITDKSKIEGAIIETCVKSEPLGVLLQSVDISPPIDVLQIDTEGFDDQVIYNSDIDLLAPRVIEFEACHLTTERYEHLCQFLEERSYFVERHGTNALAILYAPKPARMSAAGI